MKRIEKLMIIYLVCAVGLLITSFARQRLGLATLSPIAPVKGLTLMAGFAVAIGLYHFGLRRLSAIMLVPMTYMIGTAVAAHVHNRLNGNWRDIYASELSWALVTLCNSYGVVVFCMAIVSSLIPATLRGRPTNIGEAP